MIAGEYGYFPVKQSKCYPTIIRPKPHLLGPPRDGMHIIPKSQNAQSQNRYTLCYYISKKPQLNKQLIVTFLSLSLTFFKNNEIN